MNQETFVAMRGEAEQTLRGLAVRVNELDAARKATYEDFLRVQGRLQVLTELLALPKEE